MVSFGTNLKSWRAFRRKTQDELASLSGVDRSTIAGLEDEDSDREPQARTLAKLADALETTPFDLLNPAPPSPPAAQQTTAGHLQSSDTQPTTDAQAHRPDMKPSTNGNSAKSA